MFGRWKYNPTYLKIKLFCKQILLPLIIIQFIRTLLFPTSFDVFLLGLFSVLLVCIELDWI